MSESDAQKKNPVIRPDYCLPDGDRLLCCKELAGELGHHVNFVYAMRSGGFVMPGGVSTVNAALIWLEKNPCPRRRISA